MDTWASLFHAKSLVGESRIRFHAKGKLFTGVHDVVAPGVLLIRNSEMAFLRLVESTLGEG